jgi:predicted N-acetyltransferase YhbS
LSSSYRKFRSGDEVALQELLKRTFPLFKESNLWFWKYRLNPSLNDSLVIVAEKEGELVGSNYWLFRDLKLSSTLQVKAALGADVAVHPDYRGQGIGTNLLRFPRVSGAFREKEILLSYMFSSPELTSRFHSPAAGYTTAPVGTVVYRKLLNCQELKAKLKEIDEVINSDNLMKKQLENLVMCISFRLTGAPDFSVHIGPEKVYLEEGEAENSDVKVEGSIPLSSLIFGGGVSVGYLAKSWLTGKIKIRGGISQILRLRKALKLFQTAFSHGC